MRFLLDEHLRGPLWSAILRHNARGQWQLNAARVGDSDDLPLGLPDDVIDFLTLVAHASEATEWKDRVHFVP